MPARLGSSARPVDGPLWTALAGGRSATLLRYVGQGQTTGRGRAVVCETTPTSFPRINVPQAKSPNISQLRIDTL